MLEDIGEMFSQCSDISYQAGESYPDTELWSLGGKSSLASKENRGKTQSSHSQANFSATHFGMDFALYAPLICGSVPSERDGMAQVL